MSSPTFPLDKFLKKRDALSLKQHFNLLSVFEIADLITSRSEKEQAFMLGIIQSKRTAEVYRCLSLPVQHALIEHMPRETAIKLVLAMRPDERTQLLERLSPEVVNLCIRRLPKQEQTVALTLLAYPKGSAGRIMTTDFIALDQELTVENALEKIREHNRFKETIDDIYITREQDVLVKTLNIKEVLFAPKESILKAIGGTECLSLSSVNTFEEAISIFRKLGRFALPVVDNKQRLLGVVTIDDILKLSSRRHTETLHKIGAVETLDKPYLTISFLDLLKKRSRWLLVLFIGEMFTATAMGFFEDQISKAVVLALFLPLIISSGGNAGSQSSTLVIRAMALGEVGIKHWRTIFLREVAMGVSLGVILGAVGFLRVCIWGGVAAVYGAHWLILAVTIFFALIGVVMWGSVIGAMLPFILRRFHQDPATSSNPLVATFVDVTGIIIYFSVAISILRGVLL